MADAIETALINIFPDFSQFNERLRLGLVNAAHQIGPVDIEARVNASQVSRSISEAVGRADRVVSLTARLDDLNFRRDLANASGNRQVILRADLDAARARLELARLGSDITVRVTAEADVTAARAAMVAFANEQRLADERADRDRVRRAAQSSSRLLGGGGGGGGDILSTLGGRGSKFTGVLVALAASTITPVTASIVALSSALAVAGAGVGIFAGAAVGHLNQVSTVLKQIKEEGQQLKDLPAPFQRLIPVLDRFKSSYNSFLTNTRGSVFDTFISGLEIAEDMLSRITPVVNAVAGGVRGALDEVGKSFAGGAFTSFLGLMETEAPDAIKTLTSTAQNLGEGFLNIFTAAYPAGKEMIGTLQEMSATFLEFTANLRGSQALQDFLDYAVKYGPKVLEIFADFGVSIYNIVIAIAPLTGAVTSLISGFLSLTSSFSPTTWKFVITTIGLAVIALKAWNITVGIATALGATGLTRGLAGMVFQLRLLPTALGVARIGVTGLSASMVALQFAIPVIGIILGVISLVALGFSAIGSSSDKTTEDLGRQKTMVDALTQSYLENAGAVDKATKLQIFNDAYEAGVFQKGIDPKKVVAGLGGDKDALNEVQAQLDQKNRDAQRRLDAFNADPLTRHDPDRPNPKAEVQRKILQKDVDDTEYQASWLRERGTASTEAASKAETARTAGLGPLADGLNDTTSIQERYNLALAKAQGLDTDAGKLAKGLIDAHTQEADALERLNDARYNQGQVAQSTADAEKSALQSIRDSQKSYRESQLASKQAVESLAKARADAARALEDQAGKETSALVANERAKREARAYGLYSGPITSESKLKRMEVQANLDSTTLARTRTDAEGVTLREQGIEGAPGVVSARKSVEDAHYNEAKAKDAVTTAETNYNRVLESGRHQRQEAQEQVDATNTSYKIAKQNVEDVAGSIIKALYPSIDVGSQKYKDMRAELEKALTMDASNPIAQMKELATIMGAVGLMKLDSSLTFDQAMVRSRTGITTETISAFNNSKAGSSRTERAFGGGIFGEGTTTSDSIPAWLSHNEHVLSAREVSGMGGHQNVERLRAAARTGALGYAAGGPISLENYDVMTATADPSIRAALSNAGATGGPTSSTSNTDVTGIQDWLRKTVDPLPYVFGATGPNAYDCSGLVGEVWAKLTGNKEYQRYFVTGNEAQFLEGHGFKKGTGAFTVGFNDHHTKGNLGGFGFNASSTKTGILTGDSAGDVTSMPNVYYLPQIGSTFIGSGGGNIKTIPPFYSFPGGDYSFPSTTDTTIGGDAGSESNRGDTVSGTLGEWIKAAIGYTGVADNWAGGPGLTGLWTLIQRESSGNPNAINLTDSNAKAGRASRGLMQTIPGTFAAYRDKRLANNIFDPVSNIVAGINYIKSRYGSIFNVQQADPNKSPRGYSMGGAVKDNGWVLADNGTMLPPRSATMVVNGTDKPEKVGFDDGATHLHIHGDVNAPVDVDLLMQRLTFMKRGFR